ncbi:MAG: hypothetical protein ACD_3C00061G0004 [uncultured bacterium (gcode 4)]|uniref:Uncharacterized protein n=1 Tax=uncultured bacterium (gcode 4) TaxID=1234023 RepID=K2GY55_9BACT|nr:MAG: hypothetical protein ACD_3C00061G0004 [uncultured bacterium (gcode 4)]
MTNSELLKLIRQYEVWDEDAIEIVRIFEVMTDDKKIEILNNWHNIAMQIKKHRDDIEKEKEILLIRAIDNIEHDIEEYNKSLVAKNTKKELKKMRK